MLHDDLRLAAIRATRGDFLDPIATDEERELLRERHGVVGDQVQDYIAWRRSLLLLATVLLGLGILFDLIGFQTFEDAIVEQAVSATESRGGRANESAIRGSVRNNVGVDNLETLDAYLYIILLGSIVSTVMVGFAAHGWHDIARSRRLTRRAWYVVLGVPLGCAVLPWAKLLDFSHLSSSDARVLETTLATGFGLMVFATVGPKILSLFPGLIRGGMTLKTLFHESATPAYITMLAAPVFALVLLLFFSAMIQMEGSILLFGGVAGLLASSIIYLWKARDLLRSHTRDEAYSIIKRIRWTAAVFSAGGVVLIAIFLLTSDGFTFLKTLSLGAAAGGNLFLTMVVGSDFLLALLHKEFQLAKQFQGSEFAAEYERKIDLLAQAGLTTLATGPEKPRRHTSEPPSPPAEEE